MANGDDNGELPSAADLLDAAVSALGGAPREGQQRMSAAVTEALAEGRHLAVQAGTGTGKSLAYLVPSIRHAVQSTKSVVVSTATIALQRQLVDRDLPRLAQALTPQLPREPQFAILKGRANYLCLNKIHTGPQDDQPSEIALFDAPADPFASSRLGREVARLTTWSSNTETGDRDDLAPGVTDQAWRQVSVTARECLGVARCPVGTDCFAERAKAQAARADIVVTNHALLAIDAITGLQVLPDHDAVVIDEAHELVDRVTSVATEEISPTSITVATRRCAQLVEDEDLDRFAGAGESVIAYLDEAPTGRWDRVADGAPEVFALLRDAAWALRTAIGGPKPGADAEAAAARNAALSAVTEVHDAAVRVLAALAEPDPSARRDVVWLARDEIRGNVRTALRVAPLSVGGLLRTRLFDESTVVLTSATLTIGGSFDAMGMAWGLPSSPSDLWTSLDVGSPFDHARSGILYIASHLKPPSREGLDPAMLDEICELITAARGRTLGLFSSMRAAKAAAEAVRARLDFPVLCQGEDTTGALVADFAKDPQTCLFGTLTLWQGVDVPGPSLSLVLIDRIPFPRPDDPLLSARARAVDARGGNGFLSVSGAHAALLLAQGAGRLLRGVEDKGVVAVLDSRLATARYSGYLRASLPPFWHSADRAVVTAALSRL